MNRNFNRKGDKSGLRYGCFAGPGTPNRTSYFNKSKKQTIVLALLVAYMVQWRGTQLKAAIVSGPIGREHSKPRLEFKWTTGKGMAKLEW